MNRFHAILVKPIETEKSTLSGKSVFEVAPTATKNEVVDAVKKLYGLDVESVRMINTPAKTRAAGRRIIEKRKTGRKAIITIKGGKTIDANQFKLKNS